MIDDLLDRLQELLERQLALVRQGRLEAALELGAQTEPYVRQIAEIRATQTGRATDREERVQRLYEDLCLALMAQRTEVSAALDALRQGRRVLDAYSRTGSLRR
ncbi:MAG: hypothetical protein M1376_01005 [Planctomycetes bacterium]|nr:hypothetical protein [Planctomycetota bacterium]